MRPTVAGKAQIRVLLISDEANPRTRHEPVCFEMMTFENTTKIWPGVCGVHKENSWITVKIWFCPINTYPKLYSHSHYCLNLYIALVTWNLVWLLDWIAILFHFINWINCILLTEKSEMWAAVSHMISPINFSFSMLFIVRLKPQVLNLIYHLQV